MDRKTVTPQMREKLRAALPAEAVKQHPSKKYLSTIKPIYVIERLNDVFGIGAWQIRTEIAAPVTSAGKSFTALMKTILEIPEYGIYYECIAGSSNDDEGDAAKGGTTDGITKIASWMEIGISVHKGNGNVSDTPKETKQPEPAKEKAQPQAEAEAQDQEVKYATAKQKEEIIRLLNNKAIDRQQKTKALLGINKLTEDQAKRFIEKLKNIIEAEDKAEHEHNLR